MHLNIELKPHRDVLVVRIGGELDHHTADDVRNRLDEALTKDSYPHVVLNFKDLTFMDSSGLGVILGRYKRINQHGGTMSVCSLPESVQKLFELSGMFKIVSVYDEETAALDSWGVTL